MSKYGNKKVEIDGFKFDSKMEGEYYLELLKQKEEGLIIDFKLQPVYVLQEAFTKRDIKFQKITYKADFEVEYPDGEVVAIDIKGMQTPLFRLKQKLFENKYTLELRLLTYVKKHGGWIETKELEKIRREARKARKREQEK